MKMLISANITELEYLCLCYFTELLQNKKQKQKYSFPAFWSQGKTVHPGPLRVREKVGVVVISNRQ